MSVRGSAIGHLDGPICYRSKLAGIGSPPPLGGPDLYARPQDASSASRVLKTLKGTCDSVLIGDPGARRRDFAQSYTAGLALEAGLTPWVVLSCRDRNRVALDAECAALADMGVGGVHCVTGDWVAGGSAAVFDLDALRLVSVAAEHGLRVSVAATPTAPPIALPPHRLATKRAAGATICFINHCGGPEPVAQFVSAAVDAGADMAFVPCVSVVSEGRSTATLARLPGVKLDERLLRRIAATEHEGTAGIDAAALQARDMLRIDGVDGVNLSGVASASSVDRSAMMMADVGRKIRPTQPSQTQG